VRVHPDIDGWTPPGATERRRILDQARSIAVVGASSNRARASNFVLTYLLGRHQYDLFPVNPRETEVHGLTCHPSLAELPVVPDIVDVFRRTEDLPAVATEAVAVGAKVLWVQLGLWSAEAARIAVDGGLEVVMDRCIKIEHARFAGGLHLAGFDTGVITSRRER
jgi:predicted CoA-binding protein